MTFDLGIILFGQGIIKFIWLLKSRSLTFWNLTWHIRKLYVLNSVFISYTTFRHKVWYCRINLGKKKLRNLFSFNFIRTVLIIITLIRTCALSWHKLTTLFWFRKGVLSRDGMIIKKMIFLCPSFICNIVVWHTQGLRTSIITPLWLVWKISVKTWR